MALDRGTLLRILTLRERQVIVARMQHGTRDDERRAAAIELHLSLDEFDDLARSAQHKITQAHLRGDAERAMAEVRPVEEALMDSAGESVEPERHNGHVGRRATVAPRIVELLRERGPMAVADVCRLMGKHGGLSGSQRYQIRALGVTFGPDTIDRSPVLRLPEHLDSELSSAGTAAAFPPGQVDEGRRREDAPADDIPPVDFGAGDPFEDAEEEPEPSVTGAKVDDTGPPGANGARGPVDVPPPFAGVEPPPEPGLRVLIPPEDAEAREEMYLGILFEQVKAGAPAHVYDRLERMLGVGDGEAREQALT